MTGRDHIIDGLLGSATDLAHQAHRLLAPVAQARQHLRARLLADGQIVPLAYAGNPPAALAAIDGACVREHLYAADLMTAIATAAGGLDSKQRDTPVRSWAHVATHRSDNDTLLSAAMASLELSVLGAIDHDLRIVDGSHGTPVIALFTAFSSYNRDVAAEAAALVNDEVLAGLHALSINTDVIAMPKADSSNDFSAQYASEGHPLMPGGDKFLATQVLEPGEMLYPRPHTQLSRLRTTVPESAPSAVQEAAAAVNDAVAHLRERASRRSVLVTYVRPATADTVLKVEYKTSTALGVDHDPHQDAVIHGGHLGAVLSDQTRGPHLQEPFPQHAVDRKVKQVGAATQALNQSLLSHLPDGADAYRHLLARGYRTS